MGASEKKKKNGGKHSKSKSNGSSLAAAIVIAVIIILAAAVTAGHMYFKDKWYLRTSLNNAVVSHITLEQSVTDFHNTYDNYCLTVKGRDGMSMQIPRESIDLTISADDHIKNAFEEQHKTFYLIALLSPQNITMTPDISYSDEKLKQLADSSELIAGSAEKPIVEPVNSYVQYDDAEGMFCVVPEIEGNKIKREVFDQSLTDALSTLELEIDISDSEKYPDMFFATTIQQNDANLQSTAKAYNEHVLYWITWQLPQSNSESLTPADVVNWYDLGEDYSVSLNKQTVMDWMEQFCLKYKTVGKTRTFTTHTGAQIQVSGGDYGWQFNYDSMLEELMAVLNADNTAQVSAFLADNSAENRQALTTTLEPIYKNTAHNFNVENPTDDYDKENYSEISIAEQYVYVYKGGELVFSAPVITGLPTADKETTKGCWYIKEHARNKTLVGENNEYETPVSYWVRITWSGIGYHDATWQAWGSWSPSKYLSVGSHGCVNMSLSDVAQLYDIVENLDPVFIY